MNNVLITGVSSGIGYDAAGALCRAGYNVFGSVRRKEDASKISEALGARFTPLIFDITDAAAVRAETARLAQALAGDGLRAVVNNAGSTIASPILYLTTDELRRQFEVNFFGHWDVTRACLPLLQKHASPRIINVSSAYGRIPLPFMGGYPASKHALEAFSDGLRIELRRMGVQVALIEPGQVDTPIWDKAEADISRNELGAFADLRPWFEAYVRRGQSSLPVEKVSRAIIEAVRSPRTKTRYLVTKNRFVTWSRPHLVPDRLYDWIIAKAMRL